MGDNSPVETRNRKKLRPNDVAEWDMKTVTVPTRAKTLNQLLKKARRTGLILQSADGQRFVLASLEHWAGFEVGAGDDFAREVKLTVVKARRSFERWLQRRPTGGGAKV